MADIIDPTPAYSLLGKVEGAEKLFLKGRHSREADLEGAVTFFLEFLRGFESFDFDTPCVTVFGSARFAEDHRYYQLARETGAALAKAGYAVMTGGGRPEHRMQHKTAVRAEAQSLPRQVYRVRTLFYPQGHTDEVFVLVYRHARWLRYARRGV